MIGYAVGPFARADLSEIYSHSRRTWGVTQADKYIEGLFDLFERIGSGSVPGKSLSPDGPDGFRVRYEAHHVYCRIASDGRVAIVTILHQHMIEADRVRRAFAKSV